MSPKYILILFLFHINCKQEKKKSEPVTVNVELISQKIKYATGFSIENYKTHKKIVINSPWPDAKYEFTYILYPKGSTKPTGYNNATFIAVPIEKTIITSTTDIPIMEYLNIENKLVGFPHTDYISSAKTRALVDKGIIQDVGNEQSLNTELVLELAPELVIGFSATGSIKAYDLIQKTKIPVVMNGSWMEQHPLGRAEWIKFIAAFYTKESKAKEVFDTIEMEYNKAKNIAHQANSIPKVMFGTEYRDVWYVPGGTSYMGKLLADANTNYVWKKEQKTGSIHLNFETVLDKAQQVDYWLGAINATSLDELLKINNKYELFQSFKNESVYSSSLVKGKTGGTLFYELGSIHPDLILKDLIKITHPELLTNYKLSFFKKLN